MDKIRLQMRMLAECLQLSLHLEIFFAKVGLVFGLFDLVLLKCSFNLCLALRWVFRLFLPVFDHGVHLHAQHFELIPK